MTFGICGSALPEPCVLLCLIAAPPGAAGHSEGTLCHLWHFTFSTFHHPLSCDVPRPAANAGCLLVSLWCRRRSRASTSTLLPFVKQNNAPCLFRNELLPTEWFHMHIQHCTSLLSHHCLLLLFFFFLRARVLDSQSQGCCFIVLPTEFHFTASCCEMVDARQHTRWAGSQGRKELFISLIFLLCIGFFMMLLLLLPGEKYWGSERGRCSRSSWPQI